MRRAILSIVVFLLFLFIIHNSLFILPFAFAQSSPLPDQPFQTQETFVKAKVIKILSESTTDIAGIKTVTQKVQVQILDGEEKGKILTLQRGTDVRLSKSQKVALYEIVIVDKTTQPNSPPIYNITDTYRLNSLLYIAIAFFLFIIFVAGSKGAGAVVGLFVSLGVIVFFIVPQILAGQNPLFISIAGALIILLTTTFLAHGFSKQTTLAVIATFTSLLLTCLFSLIAVYVAHLAGLGTEDSYLLELNPAQSINPKGLLLGGIIIGTLGALNDITTTQVAALFALFRTNPKVDFLHLIEEGFTIGREHIVSLVNTLVLAYAGSSLTIFIFFVLNPSHLPIWVIINNESVSEEIVRTLAGSFGLVLAIPITTFLAAWFLLRKRNKI